MVPPLVFFRIILKLGRDFFYSITNENLEEEGWKMKRFKFVYGVWLVLLFSVISISRGFSQILVSIPDTTVTVGDTVVIPLTVSELPDSIFSYQFTLIYENEVVQYLGFDISQTISEQWSPLQPFVNDQVPGRILVGDYGLQQFSGSGTLIKLSFLAVGGHQDSTEMHFEQFLFNSGNPEAVVNDGKIALVAPLIGVHFRSNINDSVKIQIDYVQKILPFDTTWFAGTQHVIGAEKAQVFHSDTRYVFEKWSDDGDTVHTVAAESDTIFQCDFLTYFYVDVQSEFGSPSGEGWYLSGSDAVIAVDSLISFGDTTRALFSEWDGTIANNNPSFSINVTNPVVETANWQVQHFLAVVSDYGNPVGAGWYNAGDSAYFHVDSISDVSTTERFVFSSWVATGTDGYSGSEANSFVVMNHPVTESAIWQHEFYLQISSVPDSLLLFDKNGWNPADSVLQIIAPEDLLWKEKIKYQFDHWTLDGVISDENPVTVRMDSARVLLAIYRTDSVLVTISGNFDNLPVYIDDVRYLLPYQEFWQYQSEHTIGVDSVVAEEDSGTRFLFANWDDGGERYHQLRADSVLNPIVQFQRQFYLSVTTKPVNLWDFYQSGWYDDGDSVKISEAPEIILQNTDTLRFENWLVDGIAVAGNPIFIFMDSSHSAVAQYDYWLTISGLISDRRGVPVADVFVRLTGDCVDSVFSNENGFFCFYELAAGTYVVSPQADWGFFEPDEREIILSTASDENINFVAIDTVKPFAEVVFPNGGEKFYAGDVDTLRWKASDNRKVDSLCFDISLDNGLHWQNLGGTKVGFTESTGDFVWQVPDSAIETGLIKLTVIDLDSNVNEDVSDASFRIIRHSDVEDATGKELPAQFQLGQNYPNPFNNSTVIPFQLPQSDHIIVEIYNFRGQRIAKIIDGNLQAGSHEIRWNGCDERGNVVSSGIYFYRIKSAKGKVATRKLLLMK